LVALGFPAGDCVSISEIIERDGIIGVGKVETVDRSELLIRSGSSATSLDARCMVVNGLPNRRRTVIEKTSFDRKSHNHMTPVSGPPSPLSAPANCKRESAFPIS
jgi:hypothetical protein